ncbi:DinB family protein [Brevibacillus laterosporus]|uniref:DinB family protein n=1 Tax=Brevibacillus laterosporus TaxID=1465 RepID=UPI00215C5D0F|nr:DinB family protein [Brevibacillus laterosporus]MCR8993560.1 DinB family protein [Brevibacillus laterosporus]
MFTFFQYNWQVRDEWLEWCKQLTTEELMMNQVGGVDNILNTLLHIIDVEYSWIRAIRGEQDVALQCEDYHTIEKVKSLSDTCRTEHEGFLKTDVHVLLNTIVIVPWDQGRFTVREILHHVIAHEIHHIGQLSVWARELHKQPVSASFLGRIYLE